MDHPATWFDGDAPRSPDEARFLVALREHHDVWERAGLDPSGTRVRTVLRPLHLQVDVPGLPPRHVNLQVGFWTSGPRGTGVEGGWGGSHLLDGGPAGALELFGLPATPGELADSRRGGSRRRSPHRSSGPTGSTPRATSWRAGGRCRDQG
ncbi:hypothetical protein [Cellulomonas sp. GbtcB1]|uniref:hypothetical protein n=1 Tax=Cellulomonas sp. GbtcB1 TaxID=2824746 RepID=UPI001C2FDA1C|nr:hypothetical protein [Cellulomonas sp. GbtcB1]